MRYKLVYRYMYFHIHIIESIDNFRFLQARNTDKFPFCPPPLGGNQEFGPRALGHRSLLAVPDSLEMKDRMNRLKALSNTLGNR